jgi:hypothetical protein
MALRDTQELSLLLETPTGALVRDTQELVLLVTSTGSASHALIRDTQELMLLIQVIGSRQVIGGNFQDSLGNPLANGTLQIKLSCDAVSNDGAQLCAGIIVVWPLDSNGNVTAGLMLRPTSLLRAANVSVPGQGFSVYYIMTAYSAAGQLCWQSRVSMPATALNLSTLVPTP